MTEARAASPDARAAARFVLRLPAETGYLAVIRELVAAAAREQALPAGELAKVVMAVDEACVNVVEHAYRGEAAPASPSIEVRVRADPSRLVVTIADRSAVAFSPMDHAVPDLSSYWEAGRPKGLGILILRRFMDRVSHSYLPGRGNRLRLVKYLTREPTAMDQA